MDNGATSIIGLLGAGSGVDMAKLARDLSAARFAARTKQLESRNEQLDMRISAAATLRSQLSQLAAAVGERVRSGDLAPTARISDPAIARIDTPPASGVAGGYSLEVHALATRQVLTSKIFPAADAAVGAGELVIRFGTVAAGQFDPNDSAAPVIIDVTADDTLVTLASKIERQASGLTAYTVQTATGAQLIIKGREGAASGFTVSAGAGPNDPRAGDLTYLNWTPEGDSGELKAAGADAVFMLDGIAMSSASNKVAGLPNGLDLVLTGTNADAPAQITFAQNNEAIRSVMTDMTAALNELAAELGSSARPVGGELGNDGGARALKRALAALPGVLVLPGAAAGVPRSLGDLGLATNRDGTFRLDNDRLNKTLTASPEGAAALFTPGLFGVHATVEKLARNVTTAGDPGSLGGSIARYQRQKQQIGGQLERLTQQQDVLRAQLSSQFGQADRRVGASQATLSLLQNQIAVWNRSDR